MRSNRIVSARGRHFVWTRRGPFSFDGRNMQPLAEDVRGSLQWQRFMQVRNAIRHVQHDAQSGILYWFSANVASRWDEYAAPLARITPQLMGRRFKTTAAFSSTTENDAYCEDRPLSIGGGMLTLDTARPAQLHISRTDGSILVLNGRSKGKDAALSTYNGSGVVVNNPGSTASDVTVTCVAETPWFDFGSPGVKRLTRIETHERALELEGPFDNYSDAYVGSRLLRIQIYGDMNPVNLLDDCTTAYKSDTAATSSQLSTTNVSQAPTFIREFTPRSDARQFKFIISNTQSNGAVFYPRTLPLCA